MTSVWLASNLFAVGGVSPDGDPDEDPLDDTWCWPGPAEAEELPPDLLLADTGDIVNLSQVPLGDYADEV